MKSDSTFNTKAKSFVVYDDNKAGGVKAQTAQASAASASQTKAKSAGAAAQRSTKTDGAAGKSKPQAASVKADKNGKTVNNGQIHTPHTILLNKGKNLGSGAIRSSVVPHREPSNYGNLNGDDLKDIDIVEDVGPVARGAIQQSENKTRSGNSDSLSLKAGALHSDTSCATNTSKGDDLGHPKININAHLNKEQRNIRSDIFSNQALRDKCMMILKTNYGIDNPTHFERALINSVIENSGSYEIMYYHIDELAKKIGKIYPEYGEEYIKSRLKFLYQMSACLKT
jgi:hypothetical protein